MPAMAGLKSAKPPAGAAAGAAMTSETGFVGAALGGVAGAAKVVQGGAMAVERGARFASKASKVAKRIERDVGNVEKMGAKFIANPNMHDALRYKGAISHMVRANAANIQEARSDFNKIRKGP